MEQENNPGSKLSLEPRISQFLNCTGYSCVSESCRCLWAQLHTNKTFYSLDPNNNTIATIQLGWYTMSERASLVREKAISTVLSLKLLQFSAHNGIIYIFKKKFNWIFVEKIWTVVVLAIWHWPTQSKCLIPTVPLSPYVGLSVFLSGLLCCSYSQRTHITSVHCNLCRARRHPASNIH